ncbi:MAG: hypothetical protein WB974_12985, partial [Acidobacteriaceae bacterium]
IWDKDGVPPAQPMNQAQMPPHWQGVLWGTLPFGSSILAILLAFIPDERRRDKGEQEDSVTPFTHEPVASGRMVS